MEGTAMIYHICPHCGADLKTPKRGAGREVVCGRCGKTVECPREAFLVPSIPEEEMIWSIPSDGYNYASYVNLVVTLASLSYFCLGPLTAIPAMIVGNLNLLGILLGQIPRIFLRRTLWGLFLAYTNLAIFFLFVMPMMASLHQVHEASGRSLCNLNLKHIGEAFKAYSAEHNSVYPTLSGIPGQLMCAPDGLYPELVKDPFWFVCVRSPMMHDRSKRLVKSCALVNDECYFYLGHAVTNDAEVETFCNGYKEAVRSGTSWHKALHVSPGRGFEGTDVIPLLGEIAGGDASRVPVLIERHRNHPGEGHGVGWFFARMLDDDSPLSRPFKFPRTPNDDVAPRVPKDSQSSLSQCYDGGGHVLYLDGHVEFKKYPDEWPMTPKTVEALEDIHALQREQK